MDHVAVCHGGAAFERDAQSLAHAAGAAVAAGEEIASHPLGGAGLLAAQRDGDARIVLLEILERDTPPCVDQRMIDDGIAQHRLDHHLAHPHGGLARLGAVVAGKDFGALLCHAGIAEAVEFAASCFPCERRDPGDVEVVLLRHGHGAQPVGDAKTAEQLHGAAVGDVHLGVPRRRGMTLDQQGTHAERSQRASHGHADRPASRDQDGNVLHVRRVWPRLPSRPSSASAARA